MRFSFNFIKTWWHRILYNKVSAIQRCYFVSYARRDIIASNLSTYRSKFQVASTIVIRNGKLDWKQGSYCWYFRLNLKFLGWPYREYIKTAKNRCFQQAFFTEDDFQAVLATLLLWLRCQLFWGKSLQIKKIIINHLWVLSSLYQ